MSKTKRPIKRINSYADNYGLDTPQKVVSAKLIREIWKLAEKKKPNE